MPERYLFIERDGGLLERAAPSAGAPTALPRLRKDCLAALASFASVGFRLVLLIDPGNEAGSDRVARDSQDRSWLLDLCGSQGVRFAAVAECGHAEACDCSLPGIGLVAGYIADAALDRSQSVVVGDGRVTAALARAMGLQAFILDADGGWSELAHNALNRPRRATVERTTRETAITVAVDLDLVAEPEISTGIGFFDHMLEQLGKHAGFRLAIACNGDLDVDEHHTVEDVALALGQALREALGDKRGIGRYGFVLPMDEAEARVAIDLSGRAFATFDASFPRDSVGGLPTELVGHFFHSLAEALGAALHIEVTGDNAHHMVEACFKGVARALRQALARSGSEMPSTKGSL